MIVDDRLADRVGSWASLKRWERRELGQELRRLGLSYREIAAIIPVAKGTLSGWCRDIELDAERASQLRLRASRPDAARRRGQLLRQRADERRARVRAAGVEEAESLRTDARWVAGTVAYWAEGAKRSNELVFSNSDPCFVRLFVLWCTKYLGTTDDRFTVRLHLHAGQDEGERTAFWVAETGMRISQFRKPYIKPEGSGHRKNVLYNGTAIVRVSRSTDLLHRVLGWIDGLRPPGPSVN